MDYLLLATEDLASHKRLLRKILRRLARRGLLLNLEKCKFGYDRIEYLGYAVTAEGIRPSDSHIAAIRKYPLPTNAKEVHSCLGLFLYFRRFVPSFSRIAKPLQNLLRRDVGFNFDQCCHDAFDELKNRLISAPVLPIYNPKKETELHTDASSLGFGAVLMQKQDDGKFHPIAYYSKAATADESRYHSFDLETLVILYALRRFEVYLKGIEFTVVTDCHSLSMTLEKRDMNHRIARWAVEFSDFTFKPKHRPGLSMGHANALIRCHPGNGQGATEVNAAEEQIAGIEETDGVAKPRSNYRMSARIGQNRADMPPTPSGISSLRREEEMIAMMDYEDVDFRLQVMQNRDPLIVALRGGWKLKR